MLYIAILLTLWVLVFVWLAEKTVSRQFGLIRDVKAKEVPTHYFYQIYAYNSILTQYGDFWEKEWVKSVIISKAREFNIDEDLFLKIAYCESGYKKDIKNTQSSASGIFQFLDSTFYYQAKKYGLRSTDKNSVEIQAELAARMLADGGFSHWYASKSCWQ